MGDGLTTGIAEPPLAWYTSIMRLLLSLLLLLALAAPVDASPYVRVAKDTKGEPVALETSVVHLRLPGGQRVDLVSAVHVGETPYYKGLNARFAGYDAVLYEMVLSVPEGEKAPVGGVQIDPKGGGSSLSQVQLTMARMLGLRFQLHAVDYAARNFRHADMTAAQFQKAMDRSGESPMSLLLKIFEIALKNPTAIDDRELEKIDIWAVLTREPTREEQMVLRRVLAQSFEQVEKLLAEVQGTTLVAGRNQRALAVLDRELGGGRRNLAIFYGAAHMADMEQRLVRKLRARVTGREWVRAWSLR